MLTIRIDRWVLVAILTIAALWGWSGAQATNSTTPSKPHTYSALQTISASQLNANFDLLYQELQGQTGTANLLDNCITTSKIAAGAVGTTDIADGALSADTTGRAKMADQFVTPIKLDPTSFFPGYGKLEVTQNTSPSAASFTVTAEWVTTLDVTLRQLHQGLSETVNVSNSGANGFDTGTISANREAFLYVIAKTDGTVDCLMSASSSSPTMPSGYSYKRRIGAYKMDGSGRMWALKQRNDRVIYHMPQQTSLNQGVSATFDTHIVAGTGTERFRPVPTTAVTMKILADERSTGSGFINDSCLHIYTGSATGVANRGTLVSYLGVDGGPVGVVCSANTSTNQANTSFSIQLELPLISNCFKSYKEDINGLNNPTYSYSYAFVLGYTDNI